MNDYVVNHSDSSLITFIQDTVISCNNYIFLKTWLKNPDTHVHIHVISMTCFLKNGTIFLLVDDKI